MFNYLAFRLHRLWRRWERGWRKSVANISHGFDLYIHGRWYQLKLVRRFAGVWLLILVIAGAGVYWQIHRLNQSAIILKPVPGGTFIEGEVGSATILNPILPDTPASIDVDSLIFDGLTKWGPNRQLEPDLATSWATSNDGKTYTFYLRHGVKWQDGVAFTAQDVLFTLSTIQDPDSGSPLAASWKGIKASAPNSYTVVITLPTAYPPFIDSTTFGIAPEHLLASVNPSLLSVANFDQHPIGTGPFTVTSFDPSSSVVTLAANPKYFGGRPKLDGFEFHFYPTSQDALTAYAQHQVDSISQVTPGISTAAGLLPNLSYYDYLLPSDTTIFFNITDSILSDHNVRQGLAEATDHQALINASEPGLAVPASQPILPLQPGYTTQYRQDNFNLKAANAALTAAGWIMGKDGLRSKNGQELKLTIVTLQGSELETMAQALAVQWRKVGVSLTVNATDLNNLEQSYIRPRNFQLLLYGIDIGPDPDVYAYWSSSQVSDPGLNLSQFKSPEADADLESARLNSNELTRALRYSAFLKVWDDAQPAIIVANPIYRYAVTTDATGPFTGSITQPSDRFANVVDWTINLEADQR